MIGMGGSLRRGVPSAPLVVVLMVAAACGSAPEDTAVTTSVGAPLDWYLAPTDDAGVLLTDLAVERDTAACMAGRGFSYLPFAVPPPTETPSRGSREFTTQYGYGLASQPPVVTSAATDPNTAIVAALGDSERRSYVQALDGDATPGCLEQARQDRESAYRDPRFDELRRAAEEMRGQIDTDPRLAAAVTGWVGCMDAAGYPGFSGVDDAARSSGRQWSALLGRPVPTGDDDTSVVANEFYSQSRPDPAQVAAFRPGEIALTVTDWDCRRSSGYAEVRDQVQLEAETRFVTDHRDDLEAFREAVTGTR